jgi:hypothetical protein
MYWLKACPRCAGDLREEKDIYGPYVGCIQCGHVLTDEDEWILRAGAATSVKAFTPAQRAA